MNVLKIDKSKLKYVMLFMLMFAVLTITPVFATAPKLVTGTQALFNDILTWILILVPVTAGVIIAYNAWLNSQQAESDGPPINYMGRIKKTLIFSAIAETASGIVTLVLNYY